MQKNDVEKHNYLNKENLSLFTEQSLKRGKDYFLDGRVTLTYVDENKGEFHASVAGSNNYGVRIDFNGDHIKKAMCNCPYNFSGYCKHIAATLFKINHVYGNTKSSLNSMFDKLSYIIKNNAERYGIDKYLKNSIPLIFEATKANNISEEECLSLFDKILYFLEYYFYNLNHDNYPKLGELILNELNSELISTQNKKNLFSRFLKWQNDKKFIKGAFLDALNVDIFCPLLIDDIIFNIKNNPSRYYNCYSFLAYNDSLAKEVLSRFSNEQLNKLASLNFSYFFNENLILGEIKKRRDNIAAITLLNNCYISSSRLFKELANIFTSLNMKDYAAKALKRILNSSDLTLEDFIEYIYIVKDNLTRDESFNLYSVASMRGFDKTFRFLIYKENDVITKMNIEEFSLLYKEIIASKAIYKPTLNRKIEILLRKKNITIKDVKIMLRIFAFYPSDIVGEYYVDNRLLTNFDDESYSTYLYIMNKKNVLDKLGLLPWRL